MKNEHRLRKLTFATPCEWKSVGRTDAEADAIVLWPPDVKNSLEKTLMLGKIEGGKRRG